MRGSRELKHEGKDSYWFACTVEAEPQPPTLKPNMGYMSVFSCQAMRLAGNTNLSENRWYM